MYGDGEKPFSNIVQSYKMLNLSKDWRLKLKSMPMDGCRTLLNNQLVHGKSIDPVMN